MPPRKPKTVTPPEPTFRRCNPPQYVELGGSKFEWAVGREPHPDMLLNVYGTEPVPFRGNRVPYRIVITESNYVRGSFGGGGSVMSSARLEVWCTDLETDSCGKRLIYVHDSRDATTAMHWWLANAYKFGEHAVQLYRKSDMDHLLGRRVWFHQDPAIIVSYLPERGCVVLQPDKRAGCERFSRPVWRDAGDGEHPDDHDTVLEDFFADSIYWWREPLAATVDVAHDKVKRIVHVDGVIWKYGDDLRAVVPPTRRRTPKGAKVKAKARKRR